MKTLRNYVAGDWFTATDGLATLYNPVTEEALAQAGTTGVDFANVLDHARTVGNPALRTMTFAQRGAFITAASKAIHAKRDELIDVAIANSGNTRGDAKFDIDGATGTLAYYGKLGASLGDRTFLVDGEHDALRGSRVVGAHVRLPRLGAAVHINAFNFPAWGLAEKAAVAWLAGMPVITKPATATAILAERIVEILVEENVVPKGALALLCGSTGNLVDLLRAQDVLAFTGSADTGNKLRSKPNIFGESVRTNIEADSLNAAVMGRDVEDGSETFDFFVREVAHEITQKAGQKCTAVRRIFVPKAILPAALEALVETVKAVKIGNPNLREVRMGPLATASQVKDFKAGLEVLAKDGKRVFGDGERGELVDVPDGKGYFVSPVMFQCDDPMNATEVHRHEVFGPCATIMPYSGDPAEAARLINLGNGGLVASLYTDDRDVAEQVMLHGAPTLGRLYIGGAKIAEGSIGSGAVLPQSIHGGPGRAGGGEELGGTRGLEFYTQRTAVQGLKTLIEKIAPAASTTEAPAAQ